MNDVSRSRLISIAESRWFGNVRSFLLLAYFVAPFLTGILAYHWQPNESYDSRKHELISSHEVDDGYVGGEHPDAWMNRTTGNVYSYEDFAAHRRAESVRMGYTWFGYGFIGCLYFAFAQSKKKAGSFFRALGIALCVNVVVSFYTFASIRW